MNPLMHLRAFQDAAAFEALHIPLHRRPHCACQDAVACQGVAFLPTSLAALETDLKMGGGIVRLNFFANFTSQQRMRK